MKPGNRGYAAVLIPAGSESAWQMRFSVQASLFCKEAF